ncbi:hypothetical protein GGX14DRAFT_620776 [Mycena pura]|uniref:Uncharacterized protein n=1 Tax=Mycena pura TaxID=153505 RepID=A0AAD6VH09_9AGAR|nr:hypothetical protein GGX14DRAFT_620776 [Mycena pura]
MPDQPTDDTHRCTAKDCPNHIPNIDGRKQCQRCRDRNKQNQAASRQRKKERAELNDAAPPAKKRKIGDGASVAVDASNVEILQRGDHSDAEDCHGDYRLYDSSEDLLRDLRDAAHQTQKSKKDFHFKGCFKVDLDGSETAKDRVQLVQRHVWQATGWRWTCVSLQDNRTEILMVFSVHCNFKLKTGHKTQFWCSQDARRKKKPKPSTNPTAKHRETPGMKRFPCQSRLVVSCHAGGDLEAGEYAIFTPVTST